MLCGHFRQYEAWGLGLPALKPPLFLGLDLDAALTIDKHYTIEIFHFSMSLTSLSSQESPPSI